MLSCQFRCNTHDFMRTHIHARVGSCTAQTINSVFLFPFLICLGCCRRLSCTRFHRHVFFAPANRRPGQKRGTLSHPCIRPNGLSYAGERNMTPGECHARHNGWRHWTSGKGNGVPGLRHERKKTVRAKKDCTEVRVNGDVSH